jgi:aconitate hydratase
MRTQFEKDLPALVPAGFELPGPGNPEGEGLPRPGESWAGEGGSEAVQIAQNHSSRIVQVDCDGETAEITDGSIVIASITSCTNTSNPSVMVGAGLLAKKAVEKGLKVKPWVKTAMAPGSQVVTDYLTESGLLPYLEELRFNVVGYGCMTCIGNSGPLPENIHNAIDENGLVVASVLSGNRNFEARIHPLVRANYLASPVLVVAYALAGRADIDLYNEPIGHGSDGEPVFLADIWPSPQEVKETVATALKPEMFTKRYATVSTGDEHWQALPLPEESSLYEWSADSTYVRLPPFFEGMGLDIPSPKDISGARVLALLGQSVTTDHISPAGAIPKNEPAGLYLKEHGVQVKDFNTFGSRRGNHEVMMRGTFGNVRIKNLLLDGKEGGYTVHFPSGEEMPIYDASMRYQADGTPLVILAGQEYGTGSSRDWAAKGTILLGVQAVIAESFERIHRSNLVGMGVLPLEFVEGQTPESLGLTGHETFDLTGIADGLEPHCLVDVKATAEDGTVTEFKAKARLDSDVDVEYYRNGGILQTVLRKMARGEM